MSPDDIIELNSGERQSTEFVVVAHDTSLRILTCAHTIADIYTVGHHHKLTLREVNDFHV